MDVKNVQPITDLDMVTLTTYKTGSLCNLCFGYGLQNYLKPFYINLEEQIIKCESSRCMFPYVRKTVHNLFSDSKPADTLNLDEFLEENAKQIGGTTPKIEAEHCTTKKEDIPILFDFSSLFTGEPLMEEQKVKNLCTTTANPWKTEDLKQGAIIKHEVLQPQSQPPPKARISRCLADVRSNRSQKLNKQLKTKRAKNNPVLVIEPHSGKSMRPLDVIRQYVKF